MHPQEALGEQVHQQCPGIHRRGHQGQVPWGHLVMSGGRAGCWD